MSAHPIANTLKELLALNGNEEYPDALEGIRVQLNDGTSLFGSVKSFYPDKHPDGFEFHKTLPARPDMKSTPLLFHLAPIFLSDGTPPVWLYFGDKPENVHHVVCSSRMKRALHQLGISE